MIFYLLVFFLWLFFLELQFNSLSAQHLTNKCLIDLSGKTGIPIIATADSHFPNPDKWQARELYKKLGWMRSKLDEQFLPKKEEMKKLMYRTHNLTGDWIEPGSPTDSSGASGDEKH